MSFIRSTPRVGLYANLPPYPRIGDIYNPTDGHSPFQWDGSAWRPIFDGAVRTKPPAASSFSILNAPGSLTFADSNGTLLITQTETGAGANYGVGALTIPATPYEVRLGLICNSISANDVGFGLGLRDSSTGRWIGGQVSFSSSTPRWFVQTFSSFTVVNSTPISDSFVHDFTINQRVYFHMKDPGGSGNLVWGLTRDGIFNTIASSETQIRNSYVATPNQLVLFTNTANAVTGRGGLVLRIIEWTYL